MNHSDRKIVQYLTEAHASETGLTRVLQAQTSVTPTGSYRRLLEKHLGETKRHASQLRTRLNEIDGANGFKPLAVGIGVAETVISQILAVGKTPFDLLRGSGGEEKVLKNAKDACAAEALEIATYTALEHLANSTGDEKTAKLAASILAEEQQMLERLLAEIPRLTEAVVDASVRGESSYDITTTGAADAVRAVGRTVKGTVEGGAKEVKRTARQARKVPGVARVEGEVKGAVAKPGDLPITGYDGLTSAEIAERLSGLSQRDLAKVAGYERAHDNRTTVLRKTSALQGDEPWLGYDEQTVEEIEQALGKIDDSAKLKAIGAYEQAHKNRTTVVRATERELAHADG